MQKSREENEKLGRGKSDSKRPSKKYTKAMNGQWDEANFIGEGTDYSNQCGQIVSETE